MLTTLISFFALFVGCSSSDESNKSSSSQENLQISATIVKTNDDHFIVTGNSQTSKDNNFYVAYLNRGEDVTFYIKTETNYYLEAIDYENSSIKYLNNYQYEVSLLNVKYSIRFSLKVEKYGGNINYDASITYDANGGEYLTKDVVFPYTTAYHRRPNTENGVGLIKRDGYNLYGWNTKDDGSGEHVGLGSRYLDIDNPNFTLYAEWAKYSDTSFFEFATNSDETGIVITKYSGQEEIISIPEYINNLPVITIAKGAFNDAVAKSIILPKSLVNIELEAFVNCALSDLYICDNIDDVYDDCFVNCENFSTVHINAIEPPRYAKADKHSPYADKMDNLILSQDKNRIIILGGSGAYYSVDACTLKERYPDYEPFNVAINAWFNNYVQLDIINRFIHEGDVFLHYVESSGKFQFLTDNVMGTYDPIFGYDNRFFNCLELNFDLVSYTDIRNISHFFDTFNDYNYARKDKIASSYTDYTVFADDRGDYTSDSNIRVKREPYAIYDRYGNVIKSAVLSEEGAIDRSSYSDEGLAKLFDYYQKFKAKGVKLFFSFACVNAGSLTYEEFTYEVLEKYVMDITNSFSDYVTVLNNLNDLILSTDWFSDSDWHLDYQHAIIFTNSLADSMGKL